MRVCKVKLEEIDMKKIYLKPTMKVVRIQYQGIICISDIRKVDGNAGLNYGGGGTGPAHARGIDDWEWLD